MLIAPVGCNELLLAGNLLMGGNGRDWAGSFCGVVISGYVRV